MAAVMEKYGISSLGQELRDLRVKAQQLSEEVAALTSFQAKQKALLDETEEALQTSRQDAAVAADAAAKALAASEATSADLKQQLKVRSNRQSVLLLLPLASPRKSLLWHR